MMKILILAVIIGSVLGEPPEYGSEHCKNVLAVDCSSYPDEPVCGYDGRNYITYMNSCEFAHGICTHHGHSLHTAYDGPCHDMPTP